MRNIQNFNCILKDQEYENVSVDSSIRQDVNIIIDIYNKEYYSIVKYSKSFFLKLNLTRPNLGYMQ